MMDMKEMQQQVDAYISQFKTGYFSPLANLARLTEEVGELAREINHEHGEKKKKSTEEPNTIEAELGDNLFVLICLANSLNIDLNKSFEDTMNKFNSRDKNRFERISEKEEN
ncbi:nucleotide pyrophosphohydrolase [Mammaliicoccus stepanovicii]|nr:nucleotide pyrophosphohydrolase [Mammaliicoccus stepanovicii]PNZ72780.1 nucleotide pyrophosphohydrolase [Mammaliicoccus stepanovicii]